MKIIKNKILKIIHNLIAQNVHNSEIQKSKKPEKFKFGPNSFSSKM